MMSDSFGSEEIETSEDVTDESSLVVRTASLKSIENEMVEIEIEDEAEEVVDEEDAEEESESEEDEVAGNLQVEEDDEVEEEAESDEQDVDEEEEDDDEGSESMEQEEPENDDEEEDDYEEEADETESEEAVEPNHARSRPIPIVLYYPNYTNLEFCLIMFYIVLALTFFGIYWLAMVLPLKRPIILKKLHNQFD